MKAINNARLIIFLSLMYWADDEFRNGNRLKASRINKVMEKYRNA